jgi:hypothetical protein
MKIFGIEELSRLLKALKASGKRIVHCHGCFDLIHPGDIEHHAADLGQPRQGQVYTGQGACLRVALCGACRVGIFR